MPDALKWYESKKDDLSPDRDGVTGKLFEFVVQGLHEGEWPIPEQRFTYFDSKAQEYRTLVSTPVITAITPGQASLGSVPTTPQFKNFVTPATTELAPLIVGDGAAWRAESTESLPWWLMLLLIIVPMSYVAVALMQRRLIQTPLVRRRKIFSVAREELMDAINRGEVQELYAIFTRLFARLYDDPSVDLTSEKLQIRLRDAGLKPDALGRWQEFVDQCAESAFSPTASEGVAKSSLLIVAEQWLIFFKERL